MARIANARIPPSTINQPINDSAGGVVSGGTGSTQ